MVVFQRALGQVHIGLEDRVSDVFRADAHRLNDTGNDGDAHRRLCTTTDRDLTNAADLGQLLSQYGISDVVNLFNPQGFRRQCHDHDR